MQTALASSIHSRPYWTSAQTLSPPQQLQMALNATEEEEEAYAAIETIANDGERTYKSPKNANYSDMRIATTASPHEMTASVFMTPPTSGLKDENASVAKREGAVGEPPKFDLSWAWEDFTSTGVQDKTLRVPNIAGSFWSESQKVEEKGLDIISRLVTMDAYGILQTILYFLQPVDLCHFSAVSRSWHWALKRDIKARVRRKEFLLRVKHARHRKENLMTLSKSKLAKGNEMSRKVLVCTDNLPNHSTRNPDTNYDQKSNYPFGIYGKHRPCTKCQSPARESQTTARCSNCQYSFCIHCFKPRLATSIHDCCIPDVGVVAYQKDHGAQSKYAVGSKHSKKRLKRL